MPEPTTAELVEQVQNLIDDARGLAGLGLDKGYDDLLYALSDALTTLSERLEAAERRCPVCLYNDWDIDYDYTDDGEMRVDRCGNCGWPPTSPHTVEEWRRQHFISPYLRDLEAMVKDRDERLEVAERALRDIVHLADNASEHYNDLGMSDVARVALEKPDA